MSAPTPQRAPEHEDVLGEWSAPGVIEPYLGEPRLSEPSLSEPSLLDPYQEERGGRDRRRRVRLGALGAHGAAVAEPAGVRVTEAVDLEVAAAWESRELRDEAYELVSHARGGAERGCGVASHLRVRDGAEDVRARDVEEATLEYLARVRPHDLIHPHPHPLTHSDGFEGGGGVPQVSWLVSVHAGGLRGVQGRSEWTVSVAAVHRSGLVLAGVVMVPGARMQLEARMGGGASSGGRRLGPLWARPLDREVLGVHLGVGAQGVTSLGRARAQVGEISAGASGAGVLAAVASSGAAGGSGVSGSVGLGWIEDAHASEVAAGMLLVVEAGGVVHVRGQHTLAGATVVGRGRCSVLAGARRSVARLAEIIEA